MNNNTAGGRADPTAVSAVAAAAPSSSSLSNNNEKTEEIFLTLLQRIQRHYHPSSSSSSNSNNNNNNADNNHIVVIDRPPDEAAFSLGKQLALTLDKMGPSIPKGISEKSLSALADTHHINPSVVHGFFTTLLQNEINNMDWLSNWIIQTEIIATNDGKDNHHHHHHKSSYNYCNHNNYDALTAMIRAYAQYQINKICNTTAATKQEGIQQNQHQSSTGGTTSATTPTTATGDGIASTYKRLTTSTARIAFLREFTNGIFARFHYKKLTNTATTATTGINNNSTIIVANQSTTSSSLPQQQNQRCLSSQQMRSLLSPLAAASVLSAQTELYESMLFLEDIWRFSFTITRRWKQQQQQQQQQQHVLLIDLLLWMNHTLDLFLLGIPSRGDNMVDDHHHRVSSSLSQNHHHPAVAYKELGHRWMVNIVELGFILYNEQDHQSIIPPKLQGWIVHIVSKTVPRLFNIVPSYRIPMDSILIPIRQHLFLVSSSAIQQRQPPSFILNSAATLRLATIIMTNPIREDTNELLGILIESIHPKQTSKVTTIILKALASIYLRDNICGPTCTELLLKLRRITTTKTTTTTKKQKGGGDDLSNIIQFLEDGVDIDNFASFLSKPHLLGNTQFTAVQQIGCLLFGIGMLFLKDEDETSSSSTTNIANATSSTNAAAGVGGGKDLVYAYLKNLLTQYPHLGISLLPILVDSINAKSLIGDGQTTIRQLEFVCDSIVQDTQCAREVWNLLGVELMKPTIPVAIRASLIRLFPKICSTNKRLYKRVIETLGNTLAGNNSNDNNSSISLQQQQPIEIRLAVIATITDLAKEDRIRDVTDVIGWIQTFIEDGGWNRPGTTLDKLESAGNATLVYYAILSLHYLVNAQELDYNLVLVVLTKRLCNIHEMDETTKLPLLVVESLAMLLGDGECDEEDSEDEDDGPQHVGVPPHVSKSVETLLNLALVPKLNPALVSKESDANRKVILLRCRRNVYASLSRYSMEGLGIDSDGVKAICAANNAADVPTLPQSSIRYSSIKTIVEEGIGLVMRSPVETINDSGSVVGIEVGIHGYVEHIDLDTTDVSDTLAGLISKLILFEEEVLGSRLWQKRGNMNSKRTAQKKLVSQFHEPMDEDLVKALPSPNSVQQIYNQNRCTATSLAALLCFEGKPLSLYADLAGDVANESSDPLLRAFTVQASLNAARSVLQQLVLTSSSSEGLEQILLEIRDWRFRLDNADNMFLTLASLALYIPEILSVYGDQSSYVEEICEDVWDAYNNFDFESNDIAKLCLGFVGVIAIRSRKVDRARDIVSILEKSITSYGGQASFGAYYAMAVIAQSCPDMQPEGENETLVVVEDLGLISRIVGFLVGELVSCFKGNRDILTGLVACIKNEEITPEVIDSLTKSLRKKNLDLIHTKKQNAKSLFIALALCLPALAAINDELLLGVYCMLENLPWGSGKGIALPSVLHACRNSGLFESKEVERIYAKYASVFEDGMDKGVPGLDDIFYAVTATVTKTIPITIRRFLVGNRTLFDVEGRANSLLAATVSLCSVPCLGCGAQRFTDSPRLSPKASTDDVQGVATLLTEAAASNEWNIYSQVATLLTGFMASIKNGVDPGFDASTGGMRLRPRPDDMDADGSKGLQLPTAQEHTILDVLMRTLINQFGQSNFHKNDSDNTRTGLVKFIGCLSVLSLPGHFAAFLEQMFHGSDQMKFECVKLLVSQIRGRPRAVFDGKDYINLAQQLSTLPVANLRTLLGHGDAAGLFIDSFAEIVPRLPSGSVEVAIENVWRLCINQVAQFPGWTLSFLSSMKTVLSSATEKKGFNVSPKTLSILRIFLLKRGFAGIRDAPWATTTTSSPTDERSIIEAYVDCLAEMPITSLIEAEFFKVKDLDGFIGEALRTRCILLLVRKREYFTNPSRASSEITAALAWFSRQLVSSEDEIFSATLLQVSCAIAEATSKENDDRRRELLLTFLDNLLLIGEASSIVGLQMLGALAFQWCNGSGSDGDLSLACLCAKRMEKWHELTTPTLQQLFRLIVHDLPFNLATYSRQEKMSNVVFNRLWRIYNKWLEQGADQETIDCVRKALICCQSVTTEVDEFATLATSMLL